MEDETQRIVLTGNISVGISISGKNIVMLVYSTCHCVKHYVGQITGHRMDRLQASYHVTIKHLYILCT